MKKTLKKILILLLISSCSSNRYVLNNNDKVDKTFLVEEINKAKNEGKIKSNKPIIVVDGKPHRFTHELKEKKLNLSKDDIKEINVLKQDVGISLYGDYAKGGVFVITTKSYIPHSQKKDNETKFTKDAKIYFIVNGKEMDQETVFKMDPNTINTLTVIKDKNEIKKYTDNDYDGVIIIELKK